MGYIGSPLVLHSNTLHSWRLGKLIMSPQSQCDGRHWLPSLPAGGGCCHPDLSAASHPPLTRWPCELRYRLNIAGGTPPSSTWTEWSLPRPAPPSSCRRPSTAANSRVWSRARSRVWSRVQSRVQSRVWSRAWSRVWSRSSSGQSQSWLLQSGEKYFIINSEKLCYHDTITSYHYNLPFYDITINNLCKIMVQQCPQLNGGTEMLWNVQIKCLHVRIVTQE